MEQQGKYIVIEGPDGTGKTTHAKLLAETLARDGSNCRYVHEPGETAIGQGLETLIKNRDLVRSPIANFLLFTAARVETYLQAIQPTIAAGGTIVSDRNWLSSVAYQGAADRVGVERVFEESRRWLPDDYMQPTFTILLYVPATQRRRMLDTRGTSEKDYFESKPSQFQQDLLKGYETAEKLIIEKGYAGCHVSAGGSIQDVHNRIMRHLKEAKVIQ